MMTLCGLDKVSKILNVKITYCVCECIIIPIGTVHKQVFCGQLRLVYEYTIKLRYEIVTKSKNNVPKSYNMVCLGDQKMVGIKWNYLELEVPFKNFGLKNVFEQKNKSSKSIYCFQHSDLIFLFFCVNAF